MTMSPAGKRAWHGSYQLLASKWTSQRLRVDLQHLRSMQIAERVHEAAASLHLEHYTCKWLDDALAFVHVLPAPALSRGARLGDEIYVT